MAYDLSIIVPVYNEQNTILSLLSKLVTAPKLTHLSLQVIVIDDGSTDNTAQLLKDRLYAEDARFVYLKHNKNLGKGAAIRTGLKLATGEYTIIQDADLEYDPNDIAALLDYAKSHNSPVVYGSRNLDPKNKRGTFAFYWGGRSVSIIANILYGLKLTDEATCYKLFKTDMIRELPLKCERFEFCPEVTALLAKQKVAIPEVSISYAPRDREHGKKIGFRDWIEAVWTLVRLRFSNTSKWIFLIAFTALIVFLRKPETLLHPQLWAEDGKIWLAQAYNLGALKSLLIPDGGYLQTFPRIFSAIATLLPLSKVPLLFNAAEFVLQVSVGLFFLTDRLKQLIPKIEMRFLLACIYLFLPNTAEMDGHLTSGQWYLAVMAFLVIIAAPAIKNRWRIFDWVVLLLSGLTGTFAIFLTPIAAVLWWKRRTKQSLINFVILMSTGLVQALSIFLLSNEQRVHALPPGLTVYEGFVIFSRQVIGGVMGGASGYAWLVNNISSADVIVPVVSCIGVAIMLYALVKGPWELKLFILFGWAVFLATLFTPTQSNLSYPIFRIFSRSTEGIRYWFIPMLGFASTLVWAVFATKVKVVRIVAVVLLFVSITGFVMDFRHHPYPDTNFAEYAKKFSELPAGESLTIPITPPSWEMTLIKR